MNFIPIAPHQQYSLLVLPRSHILACQGEHAYNAFDVMAMSPTSPKAVRE